MRVVKLNCATKIPNHHVHHHVSIDQCIWSIRKTTIEFVAKATPKQEVKACYECKGVEACRPRRLSESSIRTSAVFGASNLYCYTVKIRKPPYLLWIFFISDEFLEIRREIRRGYRTWWFWIWWINRQKFQMWLETLFMLLCKLMQQSYRRFLFKTATSLTQNKLFDCPLHDALKQALFLLLNHPSLKE